MTRPTKSSRDAAKPKRRQAAAARHVRAGRPKLYADAAIECVLRQHASGTTLKAASESAGLDYSNVRRRISESGELSTLYARAREDYAHSRVAEMTHIAETERDVQRARLKCDIIKWEVAKVLPRIYGDKIQLSGTEGSSSIGQAVSLDLSPADAYLQMMRVGKG